MFASAVFMVICVGALLLSVVECVTVFRLPYEAWRHRHTVGLLLRTAAVACWTGLWIYRRVSGSATSSWYGLLVGSAIVYMLSLWLFGGPKEIGRNYKSELSGPK